MSGIDSDPKRREVIVTSSRLMQFTVRFVLLAMANGHDYLGRDWPWVQLEDHKGELTITWDVQPSIDEELWAVTAWSLCGEYRIRHEILSTGVMANILEIAE